MGGTGWQVIVGVGPSASLLFASLFQGGTDAAAMAAGGDVFVLRLPFNCQQVRLARRAPPRVPPPVPRCPALIRARAGV